MNITNSSSDHNVITQELKMLLMEVMDMDDDNLLDECKHLSTSGVDIRSINVIIDEFEKNKKLNISSRRVLEATYLLAYGLNGVIV